MSITRRRSKKRSSLEKESDPSLTSSGYKQYKGDKRREEPFLLTNIKVGGTLLMVLLCLFSIYNIHHLGDVIKVSLMKNGGDISHLESEGIWSKYVNDDAISAQSSSEVKKITVFPTFELGIESSYDVWGILETLKGLGDESGRANQKEQSSLKSLREIIEDHKMQFANRYGGVNAARAILAKALITFSPSSHTRENNLENKYNNTNVEHEDTVDPPTTNNGDYKSIPQGLRYTANRIREARDKKRPFNLSFAGGSAVSGRGNYFEDSFPNVLAKVLTEPFAALGVELNVRNAAISDIGTFPYGWCLKNFLGEDVDAVSWDPEMVNMGDTITSFEAYLRNAITLKHAPMFITRENAYSEVRRSLLQRYVDFGAITDALVVNLDAAMELFKELDDSILPEGLQEWYEFSAPMGAPGKTRSNMSKNQHELMGQVLGMYFLTALELVAVDIYGTLLPKGSLKMDPLLKADFKHYLLPPPLNTEDNKYDVVTMNTTIMFGTPTEDPSQWYMNDIQCMSTFDPITSGALQDYVLSGSDAEELDLMLPKGPMLYNQNWVMDLGHVAKNLDRSVMKFDLGYQDRRKAYFGVAPSGNLTIFIPFQSDHPSVKLDKSKNPKDMIKNIIVCEANERSVCKMNQDMKFHLGGYASIAGVVEANGVSYSGRKLCVSLDIPDEAEWSRRQVKKSGIFLRKKKTEEIGLELSISVSNRLIFWKDGPCSVSHVISEWIR